MTKSREKKDFDVQFKRYSALSAAVDKKAGEIFTSFVGQRAARLKGLPHQETREAIIQALEADHGAQAADEIAFHMLDWAEDAALLVALILYPERFTKDEIGVAITDFLVHVPYHVGAAAKLVGTGAESEACPRPRKDKTSR